MNRRSTWRRSAAAALIALASLASSAADARGGRMAIHPSFGGHGGFGGGGGFSGGGGGFGGGSISRPGGGGSGTRHTGGDVDHHGMVGWDQASRGPPRPDPNPGPGPGPGPRPGPPRPYPVPVPVPYAWGPYWDNWDNWYDWGDDFAGAAFAGAIVGTAVGAAAAADNPRVGTVVDVLPGGCVVVARNGTTYEQCGAVWYQPRYAGTAVQYVVVSPP